VTPEARGPGDAGTVLLDLDGTLTDSRPGIVACLRQTLDELGRPADPADDLTWAIGPPSADVFARLLAPYSGAGVDEAVQRYRAIYAGKGLFDNAPYPGIAEMLAALRRDGRRLLVATSKRQDFARRILAHFRLDEAFEGIYGALPGGGLDRKAELIAHVMTRHAIPPGGGVMVGDRSHDVTAAHANRLRAIGVLWGYGARQELEGAGADALAQAPREVAALVGGMAGRTG
jgi:phosphoglycolate phosphatase